MFPRLRKMSVKPHGTLLLWALLALMGIHGLARDRDAFADQPPPPPEPNPTEIVVPRGGSVMITLSAYSITSPIIRFRIKRGPKGQLGTPQMATADTAVVRYKPPAGAGPGEDSFLFTVQSEAGVSAPAEVRIKITDKDPLLVAPLDLEFGELLPGQSARRTLELQNIGGGLAQGMVRVPEGWTVEGDAAYRIGAGAKQSFTLVFAPPEEGGYTGDVQYTGNPERATDLTGQGVAPMAVTSGTVELTMAGTMRMGMIRVENRTDGVRTVRVTAGAHVGADSTLAVPAKGMADIAVRATGDGEIDDYVTVEGEGLKADVPVHAAAVRPLDPATAESAPAAPWARGPAGMSPLANHPAPTPAPTPDDWALSSMSLPSLAPDTQAMPAPEAMWVVALAIGKVGETDARVGCNFKGAGQAHSYRLELQTVGMDSQNRPGALWVPFPGATIETRGTIVVAEMTKLQPGTLYVVRLVGLDDQGSVIETSSSGGVWTVAPARPWWRRWGWAGALAVAAGGAGAWWWWTRRR